MKSFFLQEAFGKFRKSILLGLYIIAVIIKSVDDASGSDSLQEVFRVVRKQYYDRTL